MRLAEIVLGGAICIVCTWLILEVTKPQSDPQVGPTNRKARPVRLEKNYWQSNKLRLYKNGIFKMYGQESGNGKYTRNGRKLHLVFSRSFSVDSLPMASGMAPTHIRSPQPNVVLDLTVDAAGQTLYQPSSPNLSSNWTRVEPTPIDELIKDLAETRFRPSIDDQEYAMDELVARGKAAVPYLSKALVSSHDSSVKMRAAMILGLNGSTEAIADLTTALDSFDTKKIERSESLIPYAILHSLGAMKARQAESAIKRYATTQIVASAAAFRTLGAIGDQRSLDFLVEQLHNPKFDRHPAVIAGIIEAIGEIGDPKALPAVLEWKSSGNPEILVALSNSMQRLEKDPVERTQFVPALLTQLETMNSISVTEAHRHLDLGDGPVAIKTVNDYVRGDLIRALGNSRDLRAIGPLTDLLKVNDPAIFESAAEALMKLDPNGTKPKLKAWLKTKGYIVDKLKPVSPG